MKRVIAGFAICSLAFPLLVLLPDHGYTGPAMFVAAFTFFGTLILGGPAFAHFRARGWFQWWRFLAGGAVAGAIVSIPFVVIGPVLYLVFVAIFSAIGAIHGVVFWLVAVWRNPAVCGLEELK